MDLLVRGRQIAQRPDPALIFETQIQRLIQVISQPRAQLEVPSSAIGRSAQRLSRPETRFRPAFGALAAVGLERLSLPFVGGCRWLFCGEYRQEPPGSGEAMPLQNRSEGSTYPSYDLAAGQY